MSDIKDSFLTTKTRCIPAYKKTQLVSVVTQINFSDLFGIIPLLSIVSDYCGLNDVDWEVVMKWGLVTIRRLPVENEGAQTSRMDELCGIRFYFTSDVQPVAGCIRITAPKARPIAVYDPSIHASFIDCCYDNIEHCVFKVGSFSSQLQKFIEQCVTSASVLHDERWTDSDVIQPCSERVSVPWVHRRSGKTTALAMVVATLAMTLKAPIFIAFSGSSRDKHLFVERIKKCYDGIDARANPYAKETMLCTVQDEHSS